MLLFEAKDSTIFKLFGKTIPALSSGDVVADNSVNGGAEEEHEIEQETVGEEPTETKKKDEVINLDTVSRLGEEPISPSTEKEDLTLKSSKKTEQEQEQGENSQDKTLKKPDKILPCPRCNSMDTKFCYYNNYNVNQPRHFCKKCQRYWTAGGVTRNVPVGAGRRKNKNFASQYRQITVPEEALLNSQPDLPNGVFHPSLNCNATLLAFGSDTPLCESMTSVLNLADRAMNNNSTTNGFNDSEELETPVTYVGGETVNDDSNKSSNTLTKPMEDETTVHGSEEQVIENCHPFPPHVPYFPSAPWSLPWNPALWSSPVPSSPPPFFPQGYTMPLYPAAACWGFTMPGAWSVPWLAQPLPNSTVSNSGPNSPTLGKHSREENMLKSNEAAVEDERSKGNSKEKCLWVPKTLRIEDLGEAAKSSIWRTLGIKNNKAELFPGGGLFKTFPSQGGETNCVIQNSSVLQANPAALSRSINFHETS